MEQTSFVERLMEFGLTRQEANIYQYMLGEGKVTGYEVAKATGISRSNAYNSLANMTEKGAAYLVEEGSTRKYVPVSLREFCRNCIRKLEESQKWLRAHVPSERTYAEGYITIEGAEHILNKVRNLLAQVEERVYLSCTRNYLLLLVGELETLMSQGKKVVIITDQPVTFDNAKVYVAEARGMQIGVIADSKYVLTGEYGEGSRNTCLYSGQENFVELYKTALANEIKLVSIREERQKS
ncbi:MAG: TrmB family transcriptional regulator [Lachnospiraceae bacterium]|nr:TrmB family transcriptional regulator [Lachnospiraceae bacterium]